MKKLLLFSLLTLLAISCKQSVDYFEPQTDTQVKFVLNVSDENKVEAKSSYPFSDVDVKKIDMLVFDKTKKFIERVKILDSNITGTGSARSFYAKFTPTTDSRTIHFVINGRDASDVDVVNFNAITVGMAEDIAMRTLCTIALAEGNAPCNSSGIVMWGTTTLASGVTAGMTVNNVSILRTVAAIEIKNTSPDFTIISISAGNAASFGKVSTTNYSSSDSNPENISLPSVSVPTIDYYGQYGQNGVWNTYNASDAQPDPILYFYEKDCPSSTYAPFIIVKGVYNGSGEFNGTTCFFKIILTDQTTNPDNPKPINIVRNHKYTITINRVDGRGYYLVNDAINRPPFGLNYSFEESNSLITHIVTDGTSAVLGISNDEYIRWESGVAVQDVEICKAYLKDYYQTSSKLNLLGNVSGGFTGLAPIVPPAESSFSIVEEGGGIYSIRLSLTNAPAIDGVVKISYKQLAIYVRVKRIAPNTFSGTTLRYYSTPLIAPGANAYFANAEKWKVEYLSGAPVKFSNSNSVPADVSQMSDINGYKSVLDTRLGNSNCYMYIDRSNSGLTESTIKVAGEFNGVLSVKRIVIK